MSNTDEFVSVKQEESIFWIPSQTGSKKNGDYKSLEPTDKSYLIGYYLGVRHIETKDGKTKSIHSFKVDKVGDPSHIDGDMPDNNELSLWGSVVIDDYMSKIKPGVFCRVKFLGSKTSKLGNSYNLWDVGYKDSVEPMNVGSQQNIGNTSPPIENETTKESTITKNESSDDDPF